MMSRKAADLRQEVFVSKFKDKTITHVDGQAINCVTFHFSDGSVVVLEGETGPLGIPAIAFGD